MISNPRKQVAKKITKNKRT